MKTVLHLLILLIAAGVVAGGAFAFSQSTYAQSLGQGGHDRPALAQSQSGGDPAASSASAPTFTPDRAGFAPDHDGAGGAAIGDVAQPLLEIGGIVLLFWLAQRLYVFAGGLMSRLRPLPGRAASG